MTDQHWFWRHVDRSAGPDGCWPWLLSYFPDGYGQVNLSEMRGKRANRVALELHLGRPIGHELVARHSCHNPPCCNPAHLLEGTVRENVHDERARGTMPIKITEADVPSIRRRVAGGETQVSIASEYKVSQSLISRIVSGQRWGYVDG